MDRETELLFYRIDDTLRRGGVTDGHFLNAGEQYHLSEYLDRCGRKGKYLFFGGSNGTERNMVFFIPDYLLDLAETSPEYLSDAMSPEFSDAVAAVKDGKGALMISNISKAEQELKLEGINLDGSRWYVIDSKRLLSWSPEVKTIGNNTVILIEFDA